MNRNYSLIQLSLSAIDVEKNFQNLKWNKAVILWFKTNSTSDRVQVYSLNKKSFVLFVSIYYI